MIRTASAKEWSEAPSQAVGARPQGLQREEAPVNASWDGQGSALGYPKKGDPGHHPETHLPAGSIQDRGKQVHVQQVL